MILPLTAPVLRIGRSPAAGLTLDDATVSRRHAVMLRDDTGIRVLDDRSPNGIWVNEERVTEVLRLLVAKEAVEKSMQVLVLLDQGASTDEVIKFLDAEVLKLAPDATAAGSGAGFGKDP